MDEHGAQSPHPLVIALFVHAFGDLVTMRCVDTLAAGEHYKATYSTSGTGVAFGLRPFSYVYSLHAVRGLSRAPQT
jgi:hypothetical protein